ncbi:O-Antigen ligase [Desulfocapsa sulfexigens DSM 10523]|uniref:O-Antigen ligase n=1 Tax=Desulfocapsa sulfexigens (strain DSM 10523 / SB164P1) TaxID=1167006 RepID=M1NH16_DESSD|nr:O-antigen ligase family protein [Desulfocapsa sulfexigens]AGF78909.1 O-Antigen ligase [Desulfocapsa sulfexigens DSM 10523]
MNSLNQKIVAATSPLLILFAFAFPLSTSAGSVLAVLLLLFWMLSGGLKEKLNEIRLNPVAVAVLLFIALHIIGLLWSEDLALGLHILKKQWKLLLFPVLLTLVKKEHVKYYMAAFIFAIFLRACKAYMVLLGIITLPPSSVFLTEGTSHVTYSPMLALACYILLQNLLFASNKPIAQYLQSALLLFFSVTMFITVGRTGQIAFFLFIAITVFQYFYRRSKLQLITGLLLIPLLITATYFSSSTFRVRTDQAYTEMQNHRLCGNTSSVGLRVWFAQNTCQLIKNNVLIGVGTGDYPAEYAKINKTNSPTLPTTDNPHNQYLLTASQLGLFGIISLIAIFISQLVVAGRIKDSLTPLRQAFPLFFLVIMLGESYLQIHVTGLLFSLFSAILYKDFSQPTSLDD